MKKLLLSLMIFSFAVILTAQESGGNRIKANDMKKKILFVVTSHKKLGYTDERTGYFLSEVSHPWKVLTDAGYEIEFVSPEGGNAPVDGLDLSDPVNKLFWEDKVYHNKISNTMRPSEVNPDIYPAVFYAGGHGTMWDFPYNKELAEIARKIYENGGIVAAVCHGPAGLVNIKLSNGEYLVNNKKVTGFTNEEEKAVKKENIVPFLLESELIRHGGVFEKSGMWQPHITVDGRLITGQNPQSAKGVGEAILKELVK